jgi:autotransporter strand-loop-strand O-heptosyltransferase
MEKKIRICQVNPGIIEIPPKGWGAIEKIIWNYQKCFRDIGAQCDIKYLSEISSADEYDIVHIHVANLAIEAKKRGIPYIFSLHDHHVFRFGKKSWLYEQNLEAIKGSIFSFTHAEFLVDFFDSTDKIFYLPHGVDTNLYKKRSTETKRDHRLLCLANNGYLDYPSYDRKGFRYAIEAAKELSLPITIVGPEDNMRFFEENPDLLEYNNINLVLSNVPENKIIELYSEHTIFLHPSELEAGHPNLTILEAISCGLPVVGTYEGSFKIGSLINCERNTESVVLGVVEAIKNYPKYLDLCQSEREALDWDKVCVKILTVYKDLINCRNEISSDDFKIKVSNFLDSLEISGIPPREDVKFNVNYINGPFIEILGNSGLDYKVDFIGKDGAIEYSTVIGCNMWTRLNKKYYGEYKIEVHNGDSLIFSTSCDPHGKKIFITLESRAIGDTLAWVPYVDEFRKKHKCHVVCSTFWNHLFVSTYPEIEFVEPGVTVGGLYAMYQIGWFYDSDRDPNLPGSVPLQKTASDILGLDFKEVKPKLHFDREKRPIESKYVTIGTASTSGCKEWEHKYWQSLVNSLIEMGYQVAVIQKTPTDLSGVLDWTGDFDLLERMNQIYHSDFYIGLGSGISWLAWAVEKHVFMIANFSEDGHEFTDNTTRITNKSVCNSCWNNQNFKFDKGDWFWCPVHKGTPRQFECQKSITPDMVLQKIKKYINE